VEDRLKVLAEEKKNNEKVLERMDEEVKRMRFREGKIKDEDYEVDIHRRIMAMTENKKEIEKEIVRLKLGVEN
jgi:ribosomal protein S10